MEKDVSGAFKEIEKDYRGACYARAVPGFQQPLFKYRYKCSGSAQGARGGWRIIAFFHEQSGTMVPIILYPKTEWEDVDKDRLATALEEVIGLMESGQTG